MNLMVTGMKYMETIVPIISLNFCLYLFTFKCGKIDHLKLLLHTLNFRQIFAYIIMVLFFSCSADTCLLWKLYSLPKDVMSKQRYGCNHLRKACILCIILCIGISCTHIWAPKVVIMRRRIRYTMLLEIVQNFLCIFG